MYVATDNLDRTYVNYKNRLEKRAQVLLSEVVVTLNREFYLSGTREALEIINNIIERSICNKINNGSNF